MLKEFLECAVLRGYSINNPLILTWISWRPSRSPPSGTASNLPAKEGMARRWSGDGQGLRQSMQRHKKGTGGLDLHYLTTRSPRIGHWAQQIASSRTQNDLRGP